MNIKINPKAKAALTKLIRNNMDKLFLFGFGRTYSLKCNISVLSEKILEYIIKKADEEGISFFFTNKNWR